MTKIKGLLATAILWLYETLTQTAKHDPLWREHHGLPPE